MAPYLRHEWARLKLPGYVETGGRAAHGVAGATPTLNTTTLGGRLRYGWQLQGGLLEVGKLHRALARADLGWRHTWGSSQMTSTQRFVSDEQVGITGAAFTSPGQPLSRHAVTLNLEAGLAPARNSRIALRYAGLYAPGRQEHAAWADFRWVF